MSFETLKWIRVVHICGFLVWMGALFGLSFILRQHSKAAQEARKDFIELEKGTAMAMDISATIAIIAGVLMIMGIEPSPMKGQGWLHAKLAVVAVVLGLHGFQRARVGKYKRGEVSAEPAWLIPVLQLSALAIVVLAAARPF